MRQAIKVLTGTSGLSAKYDSVRLGVELGKNIPLTKAVNVDIDNTGRITTAKGYSQALTGSWHSLFASTNEDYFLGVKDNMLVAVDSNLSVTNLLSNINTSVSYVSTFNGVEEEIFFCTGEANGVVKNKVLYPWGLIVPTEPVQTVSYSAVPVGKLLGSINGRIYVAKDNLLFWTLPFAYYCANLMDYVQFDSPIQTLTCLDEGIWIGTLTGLYWLAGRSPKEFSLTKKRNTGVVANTAVVKNVYKEGSDVTTVVFVAAAGSGIYILDNTGNCYPITYEKAKFPALHNGFAYIDSEDKYTVNYMED